MASRNENDNRSLLYLENLTLPSVGLLTLFSLQFNLHIYVLTFNPKTNINIYHPLPFNFLLFAVLNE